MTPHKIIATCALVAVLAACETNPITGRNQFVFMTSEESAISESAQAYQTAMTGLAKNGKISDDPALNARIHRITDRLIDEAVKYRPETRNWAWNVKVIDDPKTVNAFCMAGGKMAVYTGLIEKINPTDDEIAQVMGHEISHALLQHTREQIAERNAAGLGIVVIGATASSNSDAQKRATLAGLGAMAFVLLPHSRQAESEADRLGLEIAAKAGYNPHAAVTLWGKMIKENGGSNFDWLSTHPASTKRIDALQALEPEMMAYYQKAPKNSPPSRAWTTTSVNERVVAPPQK